MKNALLGLILLILVISSASPLPAQPRFVPDTVIYFSPAKPELSAGSMSTLLKQSWGIDLTISGNGFGLGGYYRKELTDDIALAISLLISDVKAEGEVEYINQYTGQTFIPNKVNRLLMLPLFANIQYRLFKDDIMDNFRPFLSAGAGPTMIFVSPYSRLIPTTIPNYQFQEEQIDFFESLKYGKAHYTFGSYVGLGAFFGASHESLLGLSARYYFVPFSKGVEVMRGGSVKTFGGFYINISFGSSY